MPSFIQTDNIIPMPIIDGSPSLFGHTPDSSQQEETKDERSIKLPRIPALDLV